MFVLPKICWNFQKHIFSQFNYSAVGVHIAVINKMVYIDSNRAIIDRIYFENVDLIMLFSWNGNDKDMNSNIYLLFKFLLAFKAITVLFSLFVV